MKKRKRTKRVKYILDLVWNLMGLTLHNLNFKNYHVDVINEKMCRSHTEPLKRVIILDLVSLILDIWKVKPRVIFCR